MNCSTDTLRAALLQDIADSPQTVFWMTDADTRCTYLYQQSVTTPAHLSAFVLADWIQRVHPDDRVQLHGFVEKAWLARESYRVQYRLVRSDGTVRWVCGTGAPRIDGNREFTGFIGAIVDLGPVHGAHMSAESDSVLRLLTENSADLISHHSPETGEYLYVSPSVRRALGYEPAEMLGTTVYDYLPDDDRELIWQEVRRQMRENAESTVVEHRFRNRAGDYIWLGSRFKLLFDPASGRPVGAIAISRDITLERQAREEVRRSEERFRGLTDLSSDWYWETDEHDRFTFVSDGLYRLFGTRPEDLLGKTREEFAADPDRSDLVAYRSHVAQRVPFRDVVYSTYAIATKSVRYAAISGEPVYVDGVFRGYRGVGRDVTRDIEVSRQLRQLATHDTLTGLPNRALLNEQLQEMIAACPPTSAVAVFFIDLDRFKEVNDSLGHVPGDLLLRDVAQRLKSALPAQALVARLGGDEFVVCVRCADREEAAIHARRLIASLDAPAQILEHEVFVHASLGICMYPEDAGTRELLFQNADIAMYRAKNAGRNCFRFYAPELGAQAKRRMTLESSMHRALERGEFELHYQPRLSLATGRVIGMEALVRWNHPQLGRVSPLEFIPLAEERGYINAIGEWVIGEACRQTAVLSARHGIALQVSVNLSARQLRDHALVSQVAGALAAAGLAPGRLELELTESALVEDMDASVELFATLKGMGVALAVDDFGTGYSALAYLSRFPFDTLKLDRSFVSQNASTSRKVIRAFVEMAHSLDLAVVAEGVEDADTRDFLTTIGCDEAQGYYWAKPLPAEEFAVFLAASLR